MAKKTEFVISYVIANVCKWCRGNDRTCLHCLGTGDHDYRRNGQVTYKEVKVKVIK